MKRTVNVLSKLNWGTRACAVLVLCATTAIALPAQTLTTLYSFCSQSGCPDGYSPYAGLVQATNGDLYGTTYFGGTGNGGTIFKIAPGGTLTTLYSFCSQSGCTDGSTPVAGLVQAANGDLYGTAGLGGASNYGTGLQNHPEWHADNAIQLLLPKRVHGRLYPPGWAGPGHRRGFLRDNRWWGRHLPSSRLWDGLQNHPEWHVDNATQFQWHGRLCPRRWARPGHRWGLLRDNGVWRDQRRVWRHRLQNHPGWHADDALQILLPDTLRGRRRPQRWARPGRRWGPLRDNEI